MEATLQRSKPKKHRQKSKQPSSDVLAVEEKQKCCDSSVKICDDDISKYSSETRHSESILKCNSEIELQSIDKSESVEYVPREKPDNCRNDIYQSAIHSSNTAEQNKSNEICDKVDLANGVEASSKNLHTSYSDIRIKPTNPFGSEEVSVKSKERLDVTDLPPLVRYPDLKSLQQCEKIHNIVSSQILVQTYTDKYQYKVANVANKVYQDFMKDIYDIESHPLMDMVHLYHRTKKSYSRCHSRIKYLNSNLKRKKDDLWKTVKKEVSAKGKCDDGYSVNIKHTYTIKVLDPIKFNEVKKTLQEIEESLLSAAFDSYSEELVRLRIEHYMHNLIHEQEKSKQIEKGIPDMELTSNGAEADSLKKCISVLFDSQRQNVEDKHYLETCQKWLKILVSTLSRNENSESGLFFLLNHVIRCPNGIENWASQLIQVPINDCEKNKEKNEVFECTCAERILLVLFLTLSPVPYKDHFLRSIKNASTDPIDGKFTVIDSEGEEEEILQMSKNWSDGDVISLLNQIPVRSLFRHFLLDAEDNNEYGIKVVSEDKFLKLFAFATAIIDILCKGLENYHSENYPSLFEIISNLIRHILLYISEYYTHHGKINTVFKSELQAVYDKLFFHVVYKIYNFEQLHVLKILPALPYSHISVKMLWNVLWIFFHPGKPEVEIYSEKDVEMKMKDDCVQSHFINHIKNFRTEDLIHLLNAIEKVIISSKEKKERVDIIKFATHLLFKVTMRDVELRKRFSNEGAILLSSVCEMYPYLVSILLQEINEENGEVANQSVNLFKKICLSNWIPDTSDISIISSWLLSNIKEEKNRLARLILKKMNFGFNEESSLVLPYDLHQKIAVLITEAYLLFDANNSEEGLISKGVKQMLQFTALGNYEDEREDFANFAWNILFSLKLHPMDRKYPPLFQVYDGAVEENDKSSSDLNVDLQPVLSAYENKHPSGCYLMIAMTKEGYSMKTLLKTGLDCLQSLVESEQYMAAIKSLYYLLPFFVKHSEDLVEKFRFLKAMHSLITADLTLISNITGEPVIGAVLLRIAAMMKYQIFKAGEHTIEFSAPLLKLWIKILMKMLHPSDKNLAYMLKNSAKQIYYLLDVLVKISFLHDYTRTCTLDLLDSYCYPALSPKTTQPSILRRLFSTDSSVYPILNQNTLPEYPWLAWYVLMSEMKQKNVQDLWLRVQMEMLKQSDGSPVTCLKKASDTMKVELEFLPIYRWAIQAFDTPVSHSVSPLIYQQFFLYYFHEVSLPNSQSHIRIGGKYFKSGPLVPLLKKMKKHISDTINYYRIKLSNKESESSQSVACSKANYCDNGFMLHSNLLKLFEAFQLWIDDESLQNSSLCLSALEPKYCPHRLELILKGDQNVWTDFVSVTCLRDEIDQKVPSYYLNKVVNEVKVPQSENRESLPEQLTRHLENYEKPLPPINLEPSVATIAAYEESTTDMCFSRDAILHSIKQNQFIIFDKAKFFCEQMERLKQLNFNFIDLTPQEYKVEPLEITEMKFCYKGHGENGCSGPAIFRLQVEKYSRNERIAERIDNNRADYLIVHDQLTRLPLKDLCMASLKIENFIRSLAKRMRQAENENADYFRKMGIALFYDQISIIDKTLPSVSDYPPSRQFFSLIIESLGEEFIDGEESELTGLAKSILKYPHAGSLALPLFNPNKSTVLNFLSVYETLTSSVTPQFANTVLALFSKIDISLWLNENAPSFENRLKIFKNICQGLLSCGSNPAPELLPVFEIIKRHFGIVLRYMFPDLFAEAVSFLINGMEDQNLSTDIFYEAFYCFGCPLFDDRTSVNDIEHTLRKFAENQHLPADQQIFISVAQLNLLQVKQVSHLLYNHFMKKRILKKQQFYKHYALYIKTTGIFLAIICHSLISLELDEISSLNQKLCLSDLWDLFHLPFLPWIHPTENTSGLDFPWTNEEVDLARYMFKIFTVCLRFFHEKILSHGCEESVLSYWWNFYIQIYVITGYRHYSVSVCHSELLNLPWHQFYPCTQDIEGMCKVLQSNLPESKEFLSKISLKIPWTEVMQNISMTKSSDYVAKVLATLGKLLIISQLQCPKEAESDTCTDIFKEFEGLSWTLLYMEDVEALLNLYYDNVDFIVLLLNFNSCAEFYVLKYLKLICCLVLNPDAKEYSNSKRILYLQKFLSAVRDCCIHKKLEMQKSVKILKEILSSLLSEINDVISNGVNPSEQANYALPLMKEFVIFLNNLQKGEIDVAVVDTLISYVSANKHSPLLLPCLKVSSSDLQSVSHMVPLIECCISTRFTDESPDTYETHSKWQLISSFFCVPLRVPEDFVKTCVQENAYLTLYCCVLHKLPHCDTVEKKKEMLQRIVQWVRESKLSTNAEAKFLLLWDRLLELSMMLVLEQEHQVVKQELMSFSWALETLAEDRSRSGFFAVIGLGQSSSLSVNFRFLCRVMAAFIQHQIPDNCTIRMEPTHVGFAASQSTSTNATSSTVNDPLTTVSALRALNNLKGLDQKKLYSALQSQISYAVECISNSKYTLMQSRELLKYFAVVLYPKDSYLAALNS